MKKPVNPRRALYPTKVKRIRVVFNDVLFIDPGITGTGFAFYPTIITSRVRGIKLTANAEGENLYTGVYRPKGSEAWEGKVADACAWFNGLMGATKPNLVVIELPELWAGSATSLASASSDALFKLTYLVGGFGEVIRRFPNSRLPLLIKAQDWKGQLPKEVVINRIKAVFTDLEKIRDHEGDAIGMGVAAQGLL